MRSTFCEPCKARLELVGQRRVPARVDDRHQRQHHRGGGEQREDRVKLGGDGKLRQTAHGLPVTYPVRQIGAKMLTFRLRLWPAGRFQRSDPWH